MRLLSMFFVVLIVSLIATETAEGNNTTAASLEPSNPGLESSTMPSTQPATTSAPKADKGNSSTAASLELTNPGLESSTMPSMQLAATAKKNSTPKADKGNNSTAASLELTNPGLESSTAPSTQPATTATKNSTQSKNITAAEETAGELETTPMLPAEPTTPVDANSTTNKNYTTGTPTTRVFYPNPVKRGHGGGLRMKTKSSKETTTGIKSGQFYILFSILGACCAGALVCAVLFILSIKKVILKE
ncbi:hypothetical protein L596_017529 [Steinernema carpocapsae]|uniref:Syndecan/Neurexin domain-containing protein n=1 Tax=Steinernema carpocapsae TaxID=34508 RepID=A0A4U5N1Y6_STECR|nr:hypothetical protein L596_017529 [Steinernema carpocapsae]